MDDADWDEEETGYRRPKPWPLRVIAFLLVVALPAYFLLRPAPDDDVVDELPTFSLPLLDKDAEEGAELDGANLDSDELAGSPVVLNFWASWCGPCKEEAPLLERMWQKYESAGVRFIGVAVQDSPIRSVRFLERMGITYPNVADLEQDLFKQLGGFGLPRTFFIDAEGAFVGGTAAPGEGQVLGAISERELEANIQKLLGRVDA